MAEFVERHWRPEIAPSTQTASGAAANDYESWRAVSLRLTGTVPNRRSRRWNSRTASARSAPREVRPHAVGEDQLGVGALPEQEVGEPLLAAGADQQVDVRHRAAVVRRIGEQAGEGLAGGLAAPRSRAAARRMASRAE